MQPNNSSCAVLAVLGVLLLGGTGAAAGQGSGIRFTVDPGVSLVWWQIDPHYNHLWATTCPDDPSWQPGEGRSPDFRYVFDPKFSDAGHPSEKIPLYPRGPVRALCRRAVSGGAVVGDTARWAVREAWVRVAADSLVTGLHMRDHYAHRMLFETHEYPEIRFRLDSLAGVRQLGDTLHATAHGVFELRGVETRFRVPVRWWPVAGGLRLVGQTEFPAQDLIRRYGMSRMKLGMGVVMKRWNMVHWGIDLVFRPLG